MQVQMTPKVMAYFLKNDYYLEADVYDKVTIYFYLLFFLTESKCKGKKSFKFHFFQSTTTIQCF